MLILRGIKKLWGSSWSKPTRKLLSSSKPSNERLTRDRDRRDQEIQGLEEAGRAVLGVVQPLRPDQHDSRSVMERLKEVLGWLKAFWKKMSSGG